ncbi:MAG: hypothetical protein R3F46_00495 [bacterium]
MIYEVSAVLITETAIEFRRILKDGTLRQQNPDGREICESMMRARFQDSGRVHWTQASFSAEPLKYEIESVYQYYFEDIQVNAVEGHISFHGPMFMDHLLVLELQELGQLPRFGEDQ